MFPLVTATEISDEAQAATYRQLLAAEGALFIGLIPTAGSLLNFGITVGSVLYNRIIAIDEILKSRMDPKIALDAWGSARDATPRWRNPGRPDNQLKYVLIFPKTGHRNRRDTRTGVHAKKRSGESPYSKV